MLLIECCWELDAEWKIALLLLFYTCGNIVVIVIDSWNILTLSWLLLLVRVWYRYILIGSLLIIRIATSHRFVLIQKVKSCLALYDNFSCWSTCLCFYLIQSEIFLCELLSCWWDMRVLLLAPCFLTLILDLANHF